MIKIKVPATTANVGPGFDSFGIALNLYNEIEIEETNKQTELLQEGNVSDIPKEKNLIYTSLTKVLDEHSYKYKGFRINISKCNIPISRGLGSSASCITAGVIAANKILGNTLSEEDVLKTCTKIEGHPDNIAPALLGGMVVSLMDNDNVIFSKVKVPNNVNFAIMIPEFKVSTEDARKVLPSSYSKEDCIFNISRASMLIAAMNNGEIEKLRICTEDKIHQPYRKHLIKNIDNIFNKCKELGSLCEFISGSGSTLAAIVKKDNKKFINNLNNYLATLDGNWKVHLLEADYSGAKIL
ncbi:homoserine kinase [Clostridium acetireducens DSM 10703]|jgi:homoserine kinase|uniref:Homoserine kinase n=1 Tax=Clostridium acetireducens DSM 10703 TaxID=1121290 RepID=A0A1E8F218_9CLOT|nr:homoserine kinase [Clostridium acetireducens]OFI07659.1 homoserine kinase [Clostridium acetireducens DSM 10703]